MREVGISKITFFPLTGDDVSAQVPTYGTAFGLPWAVSLETENQYSEGEYYADNIVESSTRKLSKVNIKMEVSSNTPPALDAKITGKGYKNGKSYSRVGQATPAYAVGYEILMDDGNIRRRILFNCCFTRNSQANKTQEDSLEGQTYTYEGVAIPLKSTKDVEMTMDLNEIKALSAPDKDKILAQFNAFFTAPVLPDAPLA